MDKEDKGMKVVDFKPKQKQEVSEEIQGRLDIVDALRKRVEAGEVTEFVATSLGADGNAVIWSNVGDIAAGAYCVIKMCLPISNKPTPAAMSATLDQITVWAFE